ncbi:MAG TPA: hypothetical protein VGF45_11925, partial [Polyangia bacterium]
MSRLRWSLVGIIAVIAVVAIFQALFTYARHDLTVGVLAVVALAGTLVVGIASLAQARRRIGRELDGLRAQPPQGELYTAARTRLESLRGSGVYPNPEALAETAAAEEAGRAYFGRYLVATTVLIGLVGTFAGLMATLGKVEPLLNETGAGGLSLLAAPLGGLHVTFGASLVAILVTLALALAQGDLVVHEELALARLRDVTIHDLIPKLWPAADSAGDRTVRALDELKVSLGDALARSLEKSLETALEKSTSRLAAQTRGESERAAKALETAAGTVEKQITRLCETITSNLADASRKQADALASNASKQNDVLAKAATTTVESVGKTAAAQAQQLEALRAEVQSGLARAAAQHGETLSGASTALLEKLAAANTTVLEGLRAELATAVATMSATTQAAVRDSLSASQDAISRVVTIGEESSRRSAEAAANAAAATVATAEAAVKGAQQALAEASAAITAAARTSAQTTEAAVSASSETARTLATTIRESLQTAVT